MLVFTCPTMSLSSVTTIVPSFRIRYSPFVWALTIAMKSMTFSTVPRQSIGVVASTKAPAKSTGPTSSAISFLLLICASFGEVKSPVSSPSSSRSSLSSLLVVSNSAILSPSLSETALRSAGELLSTV